jgi:hypothetical protein
VQLWVAEYRKVFAGKPRLMLFHCPPHIDSRLIANEFKKAGEYVYNLEDATQALGMEVRYADISYKEKRRRKNKYGYYRVNR